MLGKKCPEKYKYVLSVDTPNRVEVDNGLVLHYFTMRQVTGFNKAIWGKFKRIVVTQGGKENLELAFGRTLAYVFDGYSISHHRFGSDYVLQKERIKGTI